MKREIPRLPISDSRGNIYSHPSLEAAGMEGGRFFRFDPRELVKLPPGSRLFMLPSRMPVGYDPASGSFTALKGYLAVAAFTPPGYTVTYNSAYREASRPRMLPLFSYAALALYKGELYAAAIKVDDDPRHDARFIEMALVRKKARGLRRIFPNNRLVRHLENCALVYGCPNAQNFFLSRYEGPLPVSPVCNARCAGCISYQPRRRCPATQPRIGFVPRPEEVRDIALYHIEKTVNPIVSFGQGCEGEPLLAADIIEKAITMIRKMTSRGMININTNASVPGAISGLFDAGLDSMRVSINSVRKVYYERYYRPKGYSFKDVTKSIKIAKKKGGFVSLNYLTMPGFTDSKDEFYALRRFLSSYRVDMIQWRNLNYDPIRYFREIALEPPSAGSTLGIEKIIRLVKNHYPALVTGYFNPYFFSLHAPKKVI